MSSLVLDYKDAAQNIDELIQNKKLLRMFSNNKTLSSVIGATELNPNQASTILTDCNHKYKPNETFSVFQSMNINFINNDSINYEGFLNFLKSARNSLKAEPLSPIFDISREIIMLIKENEQQIQNLNNTINENSKTIDELLENESNTANKYENDLSELRERLEILTAEKESLKDMNDNLLKENSNLSEQIKAKENELQNSEASSPINQGSKVTDIEFVEDDDLQINDASLNDRIAQLSEQIKNNETQLKEQGNLLEARQKEINQLKSKLRDDENQINDSKKEINELKSKLQQKQKEINEHNSTLEQKQDEINELKLKLEQKQKEINKLKSKLQVEENQINDNKNEINQLKNDIKDKEKLINRLNVSIDSLKQENSDLSDELNNSETETKRLSMEIRRLKQNQNEINELKSTLQQKQKETNNLKSKLEQKQNEINEHNSKLQQKQKEINELKSKLERKQNETKINDHNRYINELPIAVEESFKLENVERKNMTQYIQTIARSIRSQESILSPANAKILYGLDTYNDVYLKFKELCNNDKDDQITILCKLKLSEFVDEQEDTIFLNACYYGNLKLMKKLIKCGCNINAVNQYGYNGMLNAVRHNSVDAACYLIENGFDKNFRCEKNGYNAIVLAAQKGHLEMFHYLLAIGLDINSCDSFNSNCAYLAARWGHFDVLEAIINCEGDCSMKNNNGAIALHAAAKSNSVKIIEHLLNFGFDIDVKDKYLHTPLHIAAINGCVDAVRFLVDHGAKTKVKDKYKKTPLNYAEAQEEEKYREVCNILREAEQNLDLTTDIDSDYFLADAESDMQSCIFLPDD